MQRPTIENHRAGLALTPLCDTIGIATKAGAQSSPLMIGSPVYLWLSQWGSRIHVSHDDRDFAMEIKTHNLLKQIMCNGFEIPRKHFPFMLASEILLHIEHQ
ncbi:hypothetical protein [Burkholderia cepacia]|uniref:hypothetical protein n=1 Tax=Burkholderia cepacia TaxID=292 RepID=UPI0018B048B5|nr:hypothetical protein [Burkholderia cepacia]